MPEISLSIGKKIYNIECDESSTSRLKELALDLNRKVNSIAIENKELDDQTCLALASLFILDEFDVQKEELINLKNNSLDSKSSLNTNEVNKKIKIIEEKLQKIINLSIA